MLQIIVGEGSVVPADAKVICDFNDPNGWEEFNQLQEQGMLGGGSESEDEDEQAKKAVEEVNQGDGKSKEANEGKEERRRRRKRRTNTSSQTWLSHSGL